MFTRVSTSQIICILSLNEERNVAPIEPVNKQKEVAPYTPASNPNLPPYGKEDLVDAQQKID
jgi:hypothetical protein